MTYSQPPVSLYQAPLTAWPVWVVRPIGRPILLEPDFSQPIGFKYGIYVDGTGAVAKDTSQFFGGSGSAKLTTDAVSGHVSEIKLNLPRFYSGKIAFEQKFLCDGAYAANKVDFGIEIRTTDFLQSRIRYTLGTNELQVETGVDVYSSLTPPAVIPRPLIGTANSAGTLWGWARLAVDLDRLMYLFLETSLLSGIYRYDLSGLSLVNRGAITSGQYTLLFFVLTVAGAAAIINSYTTDWAIALIG